ncbi:hypothetical protein GCM10009547_13850 [Sporichthya brevicatena]|uniref:Uncharacterized protein n=1 Tax=Sporichthya brevicatena TaxID=171442 RepID=A0ABN1GK22_9ACTN
MHSVQAKVIFGRMSCDLLATVVPLYVCSRDLLRNYLRPVFQRASIASAIEASFDCTRLTRT